jgi:N-acyl-D-amino-acid deacylase
MSLEDAVRKMTSFPADRLGIDDRGRIQEGLFADLMVFDPKTVDTDPTFVKPTARPRGMPHVFVDGVEVALDGDPTGTLPGRVQ